MNTLKIICPNGHLGFAPIRTESFHIAVQARPDVVAADSGSDDVGPVPLGSDTSTSPQAWQRHDLEHMLLASRQLGVPMIIGSAGDTGSNSRVDLYVRIIEELAAKHRLKPFRLGSFYSEVGKERVRRAIRNGQGVKGLDGFTDLTEAELDATDRIVAMAGVHPYVELLKQGADVIIGGRSSDAAVFAGPALYHGFPADYAYYLGKVLECASFCAEPYGGKETVMGEISQQDVRVTAMSPAQRCTVASVSGHAMYERSNPYEEFFAGGKLDMTHCRYEQISEKTTRITGSRFIADQAVRVKLEGAGKVGERYVGICGIRDPYTVANVDRGGHAGGSLRQDGHQVAARPCCRRAGQAGQRDLRHGRRGLDRPHGLGNAERCVQDPIAVTSRQASPSFPDLPPMASAAPGFVADIWVTVFAPAGTPVELVQRLNREINEVSKTKEVRDLLQSDGATPTPLTPEELGPRIRESFAAWKKIATDKNIVAQ